MFQEPSIKVGDEFDTTKSGRCIVTEYKDSEHITIMFYLTGSIKTVRADKLKVGMVMDKSDIGYTLRRNTAPDKDYRPSWGDSKIRKLWYSVLNKVKCNSECDMCARWYTFENFENDVMKLPGFDEWDSGVKCYFHFNALGRQVGIYNSVYCCFIPVEEYHKMELHKVVADGHL